MLRKAIPYIQHIIAKWLLISKAAIEGALTFGVLEGNSTGKSRCPWRNTKNVFLAEPAVLSGNSIVFLKTLLLLVK